MRKFWSNDKLGVTPPAASSATAAAARMRAMSPGVSLQRYAGAPIGMTRFDQLPAALDQLRRGRRERMVKARGDIAAAVTPIDGSLALDDNIKDEHRAMWSLDAAPRSRYQ